MKRDGVGDGKASDLGLPGRVACGVTQCVRSVHARRHAGSLLAPGVAPVQIAPRTRVAAPHGQAAPAVPVLPLHGNLEIRHRLPTATMSTTSATYLARVPGAERRARWQLLDPTAMGGPSKSYTARPFNRDDRWPTGGLWYTCALLESVPIGRLCVRSSVDSSELCLAASWSPSLSRCHSRRLLIRGRLGGQPVEHSYHSGSVSPCHQKPSLTHSSSILPYHGPACFALPGACSTRSRVGIGSEAWWPGHLACGGCGDTQCA